MIGYGYIKFDNFKKLIDSGLMECRWDVIVPHATFYVWVKTPNNVSSKQCSEKLLDEAGIVSTPGSGMGASGEGTVPEERITHAIERIGKLHW